MAEFTSLRHSRCHSLSSLSYPSLKLKIDELAVNAPRELVDEIRASHDMTVEEAAWKSVEDCLEGWVVEFNDRVAGITGVTHISWDVACPWLLTTTVAASSPRAFLKLSKAFLERWSEVYTVQRNWIDSRYRQALTWARHCKFRECGLEQIGSSGIPFMRVEYRKTWEQQ